MADTQKNEYKFDYVIDIEHVKSIMQNKMNRALEESLSESLRWDNDIIKKVKEQLKSFIYSDDFSAYVRQLIIEIANEQVGDLISDFFKAEGKKALKAMINDEIQKNIFTKKDSNNG